MNPKDIPIPVNEGQPAEPGIHFDGERWHTHFLIGRHKETFGPPYLTAREASAVCRHLWERIAS